MCVYFEPGQCGVCAALVTFCLSQPKRSRRCVYLCLCVVWVLNAEAAGATPYLWSHFICGPLCDQTYLCPMSLCADVSLSVHRCLRLCLWVCAQHCCWLWKSQRGKGKVAATSISQRPWDLRKWLLLISVGIASLNVYIIHSYGECPKLKKI